MSDLNWRITPTEFLNEIGLSFKIRGNWLQLQNCPFCDGANYGDSFSFNIHKADGNFFCHRQKSCGEKGSFWKLIELFNRNPKDYFGERLSHKQKKKRYRFQ